VHLVSMEGYGTDVFIRLDHIGNVLEFSDYDGFDIWRSLKNQPTDDDYKGILNTTATYTYICKSDMCTCVCV
jgi:hypothetical protein